MSPILLVWSILLLVFVGVPSVYYLYMRHIASQPWKLKMDKDYTPLITILVPTYNEEKSIKFKLENLSKLEYPKEKVEIILVNDSSTDKSLQEICNFQISHPEIDIQVLSNTQRLGKSRSLNSALKQAKGEVIVVSDADCFLSPDILTKALPYLLDSSVGAITGLETLLNPNQSWVTETEIMYNDAVHTIRIGESKFHSTIFFQGGFGAYKRALITQFDEETDDSGTALSVVQKHARTLLVPEAVYFTTFPSTWKGKIATKTRRARQLVRIWIKCLKLSLKKQLVLPKKIFIPEAFLYLINPIVFIFLIGATVLLVYRYPIFLLVLSTIFLPLLFVKKTRTLILEVVQDNCILLSALLAFISNKQFATWKTMDVSRAYLTNDILKRENLI